MYYGGALFVVAGALGDFEGPVELLQQHDPGQMVGEGHFGHGQAQVGTLLDSGMESVGGADDKAELAAALAGPVGDPAAE